MSWKRLLFSVPLGFAIIIADGALLIFVNQLYRPGHPPGWMTHAIFYFDAWPVLITQRIFPSTANHTSAGPTFLAIAAGGLIDLIILSVVVYALRSWRARRKARV